MSTRVFTAVAVALLCTFSAICVEASPVLDAEAAPTKSTSRFGEVEKKENEMIAKRKENRRARNRDRVPEEKVRVKSYRRGNKAALVDKPLKDVVRDYEFEEMFIEHPDIFNVSVLKELTIQARVQSVYVSHSIPNEPRMWGRKLNKDVPPVILLHGAHFSSSTWDTTNTITALVTAGYHVYTVDLPGYGRSEGTVDQPLREDFLRGLIAKLEIVKPFIVSPSMSGSFSVPFIRDYPREVSGLVAIAATNLKQISAPTWKILGEKLWIMYVYGEKDEVIGAPGAKYFENATDIEVFKMKQGSHPCYLDNPKQFNQKLLKFLARATKTSDTKLENAQGKKIEQDEKKKQKETDLAEKRSRQ
eukprot:m.62501 g.62501  ORF g.62501 m.62501 type:complete len:360 (-) comp23166_c0_seq1:248-1327(-)